MPLLHAIEKDLLGSEGFQIASLTKQEQSHYLNLLRILGEGEASCITMAYKRNGIVVTDDRVARNICREKSIAMTGTIGVLKAAYLEGILELSQADNMLSQMISCGFYSPIQQISEVI